MTFGKSFAVVCQIIAKQGMRTEKESNLELSSIYHTEVKTTIKLQLNGHTSPRPSLIKSEVIVGV